MASARNRNLNSLRVSASFTLIEMLVVLGIIGLVASMTIPMMIPFVRQRKMTLASETVKAVCLLARSKAIKERRRISVTLLEAERLVIINDYDKIKRMLPILDLATALDNSDLTQPEIELLRSGVSVNRNDFYVTLTSGPGATQQRRVVETNGDTLVVDRAWDPAEPWIYPEAGDEYVIGDNKSSKDRSPHWVGNYADAVERERILTLMALEKPRTLPEGARFDLDGDEDDEANRHPTAPDPHAWTYVFLPTGGVWTLPVGATDSRDTWSQTTYTDTATNRPSGPRIYAPEDRDVVRIVVYGMTGQARAE